MLLAGLQSQSQRAVATRINRNPHNPPRHGAFVIIAAGKKCRVWPTKAQGHAKALARPNGNIRPHRAGVFQKHQRQQIRCHNPQRACTVQGADFMCKIAQMPIAARILKNRAEHLFRYHLLWRAHRNGNSQRRSAGFNHRNGLRMTAVIYKKTHRF